MTNPHTPHLTIARFVDLSGYSVGGSVIMFYWNGETVDATCHAHLYANSLLPFNIRGKVYVALMQHYTDGYSYADSILRVGRRGWRLTHTKQPWLKLVSFYGRLLNRAKGKGEVERETYLAFMAGAYLQMHDYVMALTGPGISDEVEV